MEVFGRFGRSVVKLRNFKLVGVGEKHRLLYDGVNLPLQYLVHSLRFAGVPPEFRRVGQYCG